MRLLQGKFHVSRLDSPTHKFTPDTSERFAWHFHLKNSTPNMSSCHLHWIPLLSTFDIAKSSGHSLRSALEPSMDPILLHHHLPRIKPMHVIIKDHFHKMSLPSVPSQCDSYICWLDGRALLMTPSSTLMLASMISMFHLDTFILGMQDSPCVTVSLSHIVVSVIICKNGVKPTNSDVLI